MRAQAFERGEGVAAAGPCRGLNAAAGAGGKLRKMTGGGPETDAHPQRSAGNVNVRSFIKETAATQRDHSVLNDGLFGALQALRAIVVNMIVGEANDPGAQRG